MVVVSTRVPAELADALDAWADAIGTCRAAVVRALIEDGIDAGVLPTPSPTSQQLLDVELERLRELSRRWMQPVT